jgi:Coenzyme PQQ synthesis protein D (PqqD)
MVGDDLFVALPGEGSIHTLNAMAAAVWRALEEPRTLAELRTLFEAAFPDIEPRRIAGDLGAAARNARTRRPGEASAVAVRARNSYMETVSQPLSLP